MVDAKRMDPQLTLLTPIYFLEYKVMYICESYSFTLSITYHNHFYYIVYLSFSLKAKNK